MGAQLKCARALSKIYKPSRTLDGAIPLQHYRHWPTVCAACVLSNTHTHTHRGLIITLFMSSAAVAVLNLLFVVGAVHVVVAVLERCGSCCWLVLQARLGMFYSCFFWVSLTRSVLSSLPFAFVLAATASSPAPAQSHIFLLSAEGG